MYVNETEQKEYYKWRIVTLFYVTLVSQKDGATLARLGISFEF